MRLCPDCNTSWPEDRFNGKHLECFRCRSKGIGVTFSGGKEVFHARTDRQAQERTIREAKANGYEAIPAWTRTDYAPSAAGMAKIAAHQTAKTSSSAPGGA